MSNSPLIDYTNLSPHYSARVFGIDTVTIHCVVGQWSAKQIADYFAQPDTKASANYGVGYDGSICLSVDEANRAWTTGGGTYTVNGISGSANDHRAITIEVASDTTHPYAVTEAAYNSLINLLVDICQRNHGIGRLRWRDDKSLVGQTDLQNMTLHRYFSDKVCPGDYLYERHFDIAKQVNARLDAMQEEKDTEYEQFKEYMDKYMAEAAFDDPSDWAKESCEKAIAKGVLKGNGNGSFNFKRPLTREQYLVMQDRLGMLG